MWRLSPACILLLYPLFTFLLPLHHCEKMSACLCEHVPIEDVIVDPGTVTMAASISKAALTSLAFCIASICMKTGTQARLGQSTCVTSSFPIAVLSGPSSHLLQKPRLRPTCLTPRVISTSLWALWLQLVYCSFMPGEIFMLA